MSTRYQVAGVMEHSHTAVLCHVCVFTGMNVASVTLASALQVRGEALSEEEIWSLLSLAAERLLEDLRNGKRVFGATESQDTESKAS